MLRLHRTDCALHCVYKLLVVVFRLHGCALLLHICSLPPRYMFSPRLRSWLLHCCVVAFVVPTTFYFPFTATHYRFYLPSLPLRYTHTRRSHICITHIPSYHFICYTHTPCHFLIPILPLHTTFATVALHCHCSLLFPRLIYHLFLLLLRFPVVLLFVTTFVVQFVVCVVCCYDFPRPRCYVVLMYDIDMCIIIHIVLL